MLALDGGTTVSENEKPGKVRYLAELREPGEGWAQQERFLRVIATIDDENDRLVKLLRVLRMMVQPGLPLSEKTWETLLMAAEAVIDMEQRFPRDGQLE